MMMMILKQTHLERKRERERKDWDNDSSKLKQNKSIIQVARLYYYDLDVE